jgi:predicted secreted Zn-dependent protease
MRSIIGAALAAGLAASAAGLGTAEAAPAFTTRYVYYKISGDSAAGVYISMLKRGPHVRGEKAYAATVMESTQQGKLQQTNSCRMTDYQIKSEFTIRLPKLADETALSPAVRDRWQQFSTFLKKHEETHRTIWLGCATEIETKIRALRGDDCDEVERKAKAIRDQIQKACTRKHAAFDASEQKRLAKHPFVRMVLAPVYNPAKSKTARLTSKKRKKSTQALLN